MSDNDFDATKRAAVYFQKDSPRVKIIASYWAVALCAIPLWWYTTSITRLALPAARVGALGWTDAFKFPVDVVISRSASDTGPSESELERAIDHRTRLDDTRWGALDVRISTRSPQNETDIFSLAFNDNPAGAAHILGDSTLSVSSASSTLPQVVDTLGELLSPYASKKHEADNQRVAKYAPKYRLSFTLLNEDVSSIGYHSWEIEQSIYQYLTPTLNQLRALHDFEIESQVQYYAPLAFQPEHVNPESADSHYTLNREDITIFVNSAEWTLSSSASNDPVLHFIVFIPSAAHRPLHVLTAQGSIAHSNAFIIPQWGGIAVYNPSDASPQEMLDTRALLSVFRTFHTQLLLLLGVPPAPHGTYHVPASNAPRTPPLTRWQLAALLRARTLENARSAAEALRSIVALVAQIGHLPVKEDVRALVRAALDDLDEVQKYTARPQADLQKAFDASRAAAGRASAAFFDPGMLAMLYFPAEHTYAVYTPLFAPVGVPLLVAVVREVRRLRKARAEERRRREKGKGRMEGERAE
ncbi:hypothetical protein AURDEDRAFT_116108 [Auricularia subglabra TFB-10046 SS5]|uniref:GPI transamidase component PIG-S n=1 Tax=Auricularia subglabra (strain TFB-10046 / SS5) TaxID=717982 RepID=J0LIX1_AURST|nr:hypothetical protein AURDEDRAFT_116108 [Auricularia subglabra TFB-10046 SS5]